MNASSGRSRGVAPCDLLAGAEALEWFVSSERPLKRRPCLAGMFGFLNPLRATPITLVSERESEWIYSFSGPSLGDSPPFRGEDTVVVVLTDGLRPGPALQSVCEQREIALVKTGLSAEQMQDFLYARLPKVLTLKCVKHGVFLAVMNTGVLVTGASGVGKSEVALDLVQRGHQLVADDAVQIYRNEQGELIGECPQGLKGYIEIRGLGIVNIEKMFGPSAVLDDYRLQFIINLQDATSRDIQELDRLQPSLDINEILETRVPCLTMLVAPGRNLSVLVEAAVRDHLLRQSGVDSSFEFLSRHDEMMTAGGYGE